MRTRIYAALSVFLTLSVAAGTVHAADPKGPRLGTPAVDQTIPGTDDMTTGSIAPAVFSVVFVADLDRTDPTRRMIEQQARNLVEVNRVRKVLADDPSAVAQLRDQHIDEANIIAVGQDVDGSNVFYVE
ncbi:hypothetical protein LJR030_005075 [Rhizobium sp. LjRoot30]|uniref:hypothetical protein n=1 Tax=Rhizobium sp. LjRoot30 TaxID=3342320 RepID=UPI003ECDEAD0